MKKVKTFEKSERKYLHSKMRKSEVSLFIEDVKTLYETDPGVKSKIHSIDGLISALRELNQLEGLENFKKDISSTVKMYLTSDGNSDRGRHNTIILGPPGCGKTTLAKVLAKIYTSLGLVKEKRSRDSHLGISTKLKGDNFSKIILTTMMLVGIASFLSLFLKWYITLIFISIVSGVMLYFFLTEDTNKYLNREEGKGEKQSPSSNKFVILKRQDLVSEYLGQSAPKTANALQSCIGKVVFIDEAYSLINSSHSDPYGKEVLTTIIQFMDEHQEETLFILGGYKEDITRNLYTSQRGLERRFSWIFSIEKYTSLQLANIFCLQFANFGLILSPSVDISEIEAVFTLNQELFPYSGGDTEVLLTYVNQLYRSEVFDKKVGKRLTPIDGVDMKMINKGIEMLARSRNKKVNDQIDLGNPKKEKENTSAQLLEALEGLKNIF